MAFDQPTRNRLARFVGEARALLTEEFTRQMQHEYGLDPLSGEITAIEKLTALDDARRETARILRETLDYYLTALSSSQSPSPAGSRVREVLERIVREQAFTVLNRLCALRMAEGRGLLIESVGRGYQSRGFQLYARLAGSALGETGEAYRSYLFSVFDEFALDLPVLFDRFSPQGRLFPREGALLRLLELINNPEIEPLWAEDETIGWIYQYFNSKEERQKMRAESQAPRNSRELAVRNQFFTPRYVVEFLTDNTLGRIWYEMTQGATGLKETCRYLVRRPEEVFLAEAATAGSEHAWDWSVEAADWLLKGDEHSFPPFETDDTSRRRLIQLASVVDGYRRYPKPAEWERWELVRMHRAIQQQDDLGTYSLQELLDILFFMYRSDYWEGGEFLNNPRELRLMARIGNEVRRRVLAGRGEDLSQEELLRAPVFIPYRPLKDPREIKMLDPACGSMHFGLYAFDLFERIYAEAWELEEQLGAEALWRMGDLRPLHETYPDKAAFLRDVPRLILERNIHGIDIDPRAVQIAGLSLWLRAQKSWQAQGLKPHERPQIRKSNIVCAEPMPGDRQMLEEFLATLSEDKLEALMRRTWQAPAGQKIRVTKQMAQALAKLVRTVWQEMELAGEAGSLLKIEETLREAIAAARQEAQEKSPLFRVLEYGLNEPPKEQYVQAMAGEDQDFFDWAEELMLAALYEYAEQAQNGHSYQRRLFAGDAIQGFDFIDLCRKSYDVVLMNPPFGDASENASKYITQNIPFWCKNLSAAFIGRFCTFIRSSLKMGCVTDRTILIKSSYEDFRRNYALSELQVSLLADLGWNVLDDANVEVSALVFSNHDKTNQSESCFIDCRNVFEKEVYLLQLITSDEIGNCRWLKSDDLRKMPNAAFSYDMPKEVIQWFNTFPPLKLSGAKALQGHAIKMDWYARLAWEIPLTEIVNYQRMYNGGDFSRFYIPSCEMVFWKNDGTFLKEHPSTRWSNAESQQLPGIGYGKRGEVLDAHIVPAGHVFTVEGLFVLPKQLSDAWYFLGLLNAPLISRILNFYCGQHKHAGYIDLLPVPSPEPGDPLKKLIADLAREGYEVKRLLSDYSEVSPYFYEPGFSLKDKKVSFVKWKKGFVDDLLLRLQQIERELEFAVEKVYHIDNKDNTWLDLGSYLMPPKTNAELTTYVHELLSYTLGVLFGRWNIHYALGIKKTEKFDPFNSLPDLPPGMLSTLQEDNNPGYPTINFSGIFSDDESHPKNILLGVRQVIGSLCENSEEVEQEIIQITKINSLREYFVNPYLFFNFHLNLYSKGRRAAPIYWALSTPSCSYTLWLYYHRLNDQILYTCVNDFVEPKLKQVSEESARLRQKRSRSAADEKELERLSDFEGELKDFRAELLRVAAFWKPNLNDGVQITAAPLWRLFQHKPWQKKLKETWEKLERGDYDWAHLAYSIWPERVREKCKSDKSLAIAHDLEHLYVEPKTSGKKKTRRKEIAEPEMESFFDEEE
jgi:hypothetical protein